MANSSWKINKGGDLLPHIESFQYNLLSLGVENGGGAAVDLGTVMFDETADPEEFTQIAGYPVIIDDPPTKATLVLTTNEAAANGLLVAGPAKTIAAGATTAEKYSVVWNGPGVINSDALPNADVNGAALVPATIISTINTAWDVKPKWVDGANESVQTT